MRILMSLIGVAVAAPAWGQISFDASATTGGALRPGFATTCTAAAKGALRSSDGVLSVCDGSTWGTLAVGAGVPTGAIMAFASATCPSGWSEYTAARGRFLRGIDNGAGVDPSGTRAPGNTQEDDFKNHNHAALASGASVINSGAGNIAAGAAIGADTGQNATGFRGGSETRPKNVAVLFCRKD